MEQHVEMVEMITCSESWLHNVAKPLLISLVGLEMIIRSALPGMIYLVGGAVRDGIMKCSCNDEDYVVVTASFEGLEQVAKDVGATILHTDRNYGLIRAKTAESSTVVDIAMARRDGVYQNKRHCAVMAGSLEDDLNRRDFTCNAIAHDTCTLEMVDPHHGVADAEARILRCVGNTSDRFAEDPLRMLRALRFMVTRTMTPCAELHEFLCSEAVHDIVHVSAERVREEMNKCFEADVGRTLALLHTYPQLWQHITSRIGLKCIICR
jgi:tRNA nucleotidyltransferase (CCA-adding enzyme)